MQTNIWEEWLKCNEKWGAFSWAMALKHTSSFEKFGCRRWMTEAQLLQKYDNRAEVVASIIETKKEPALINTHVKPHPDAPTCAVPRPCLNQFSKRLRSSRSIWCGTLSQRSPKRGPCWSRTFV